MRPWAELEPSPITVRHGEICGEAVPSRGQAAAQDSFARSPYPLLKGQSTCQGLFLNRWFSIRVAPAPGRLPRRHGAASIARSRIVAAPRRSVAALARSKLQAPLLLRSWSPPGGGPFAVAHSRP